MLATKSVVKQPVINVSILSVIQIVQADMMTNITFGVRNVLISENIKKTIWDSINHLRICRL